MIYILGPLIVYRLILNASNIALLVNSSQILSAFYNPTSYVKTDACFF